jgi:hypothetical protein
MPITKTDQNPEEVVGVTVERFGVPAPVPGGGYYYRRREHRADGAFTSMPATELEWLTAELDRLDGLRPIHEGEDDFEDALSTAERLRSMLDDAHEVDP